MKRTLIILFIAISGLASGQCRIAEIISVNRAAFASPYKYDGFNYFKVPFKQTEQVIKKEFIAFKGQHYQLLFCTSGFEETVRLQVYDANDNSLLAGTTIGKDVSRWSFFATKTGTYTIQYAIPVSATEVDHEECIAMLIGFSEK